MSPSLLLVPNLFQALDKVETVEWALGILIAIAGWLFRKYVKPMHDQLTTGSAKVRKEDNIPTIKDLLIENYRTMMKINNRQEDTEVNQAALVATLGGVQESVKKVNDKLDAHILEGEVYKPIIEEMIQHLKEHTK